MAFVRAYSPVARKVVYEDSSGARYVFTGGTRAWRTCNPGNIIRSAFARKHGSIGDDGVNAIFPSEKVGRAALTGLLKTQTYQRLTVAAAIERYAPASDGNDPDAYQRFVRDRTGIDLDRVMSMLKKSELNALREAIEVMEGWREGEIRGPAAPEDIEPRSARAYTQDWLRVAESEAALSTRERSEWADPGENPRIINYFRSTWMDPMQYGGDEVAWCAAFVNHCLETSGHDGTNHPGARSFAWPNWGVQIDEPVHGCIAVFQDLPNPDPAWGNGTGHVGFVVDWNQHGVTLLGGNQSNTINRRHYAYETSDRRLFCLKLPRMA